MSLRIEKGAKIMGNVASKSMSESRSIKERQIFPQDTNHLHTMFGGILMANVDEISAITATKHSNSQVVTASTDSVDFLKPIKQGISFLTKQWFRMLVSLRWKFVYKSLLKVLLRANVI